MNFKIVKLFCYAVILNMIGACSYFASWEDTHDSWIGYPVTDYGPPDDIRELENGYKEYKYWYKEHDPSCIHFWIVDSEGIMRSYHYQGSCSII